MRIAAVLLLCPLAAAPASAQGLSGTPTLPATSPFRGGVPSGTASADPITLSVRDVIDRALDHNLGVLLAQEGVERARGARWEALSELLPHVDGRLSAVRQKSSLEAFGLPLGPGFPRIVGPYAVYDGRVFLSQSIFDWQAISEARARRHALEAERHTARDARELVILVAANVYLQTLAMSARAESARAQAQTAEALHTQAQDLRRSGIVPGIDVLRAEVRLATERQQATAAQNDYDKAKLQLARLIGLPLGQPFTLAGLPPDLPMPSRTAEEVIADAYARRPDYLAALERVRAAEASREAARGELLPALRLNADYGGVGLTPGSALPTYSLAGVVTVPLFQGGHAIGAAATAAADLRQRQAELADLRAEIDYDVRAAFLDLQASGEQLQAATRARELATLQLTQARDRFAAGVTSNVEVVQAQEDLALATEQYIGALYGFNLSKALLARAGGSAEDAVEQYLGGPRQ